MHRRDIFSIFYNITVWCVFSLESPHRGDSNGYTQYTIFNIKKANRPKLSAAMGFSQGTQKRVRNSHGKRAISVRAIEVLLYLGYACPSSGDFIWVNGIYSNQVIKGSVIPLFKNRIHKYLPSQPMHPIQFQNLDPFPGIKGILF